jgi:hypothetical protein
MDRTFLVFSDAGGGGRDSRRSSVLPRTSVDFDALLFQGQRIKTSSRPPLVEITSQVPLEDMPWDHGLPIVSTRLRDLLEQEAPGHAQFIQVRLGGPEWLLPTNHYFIVNWLNLIDCIDRRKSEYEGEPGTNEFVPVRIVINYGAIPQAVKIFRLKHMASTVLIDEKVATVIKASGISGPQFYRRIGLEISSMALGLHAEELRKNRRARPSMRLRSSSRRSPRGSSA